MELIVVMAERVHVPSGGCAAARSSLRPQREGREWPIPNIATQSLGPVQFA